MTKSKLTAIIVAIVVLAGGVAFAATQAGEDAVLSQSWTTMQTASLYQRYKKQNPAESARLAAYWANGGTVPSITTAFGKALLLEAQAYWSLHGTPPPPPPPGDTTPPTVSLTAPANGATVTGTINVTANAADNVAVTKVEFYRDGSLFSTDTTSPYATSFDTTTVANGPHTFVPRAYDAAGNNTSGTTVGVTVSNVTPPPPTGNVFISPTGNDGNNCSSGAPCRTWTRGYQAAASGNTISVAAGSYPGWDLTGSKTVTFRVSGGTATLTSRINLQTLQNATVWGPVNITVPAENDLSMKMSGCTSNIEMHNVTGHTFDISDSSTNIRVFDGDWGNYTQRSFSSDSVVSGGAGFPGWTGCGDGIVRNVVFDGVRFHDVQFVDSSQWGGGHPDCVESSGSTDGVTFRNGMFDHCGNTFIGWYTDWGSNYNLLVENNLMYKTTDATFYGVQIGNKPGYSCGGMVFRYNTYDPDAPGAAYPYAPPLMGCTNDPSGFQVYGNIFRAGSPGGDCGNATFSYNVWEQAPSCGANSVVGTAGYVARGSDYHLAAGAFAIGKGDPSRFPGTDFEGTLRSSPPDAGYDER